MSDIIAQKKALRARCLALRSEPDDRARAAANAAISRHIATHSAFLGADLILGFFPVRGEPDLTALWQLAAVRGIPVAFPRCVGTEMTFHIATPEELIPDRFGIPAPLPGAPRPQMTSRTLCIMPGLAAGRDGTRLGYGGGFYDRFLDTFEGITLFPLYSALLFPTLPTEPTDHRVTYLVTEKGEIDISCQS